MSGFEVRRITKGQAAQMVTAKHYSRKMPIFWHGFGLIRNEMIEGVVIYGQPSPAIQKHAFKDRHFPLMELSRLVIQCNDKNAASLLIGRSLKMLPSCAVVSYADSEYGHSGCVYQATNWLYTGQTLSHDHAYILDGKRIHPMTLRDAGITNPKKWAKENGIETIRPSPKHRYFTFVGRRKDKISMRAALNYEIIAEYPKLDQSRYDDGPKISIMLESDRQISLFD